MGEDGLLGSGGGRGGIGCSRKGHEEGVALSVNLMALPLVEVGV
jgi:hypothetical protein